MGRTTDTRERILDTAEELFARYGYAATSITDIADRVGIRGPGVYKHYRNKLHIYECVLARLFDPLHDVIESLSHGDTPEDMMRQVRVVLTNHAERPNMARLIQHATLANDETLKILADKWYRPFFSYISELSATTEKSWINIPSVMTFHCMILGYITLAPLHARIFDLDPLSDNLVQTQLDFQHKLLELIGDEA
ncbi:TetR/AcrR family transcriptional regulator [Litorivivens sp.]|uniref:TetR/AcrR family transcriptional regulator n=1 Tax=Litorivivens sp. TaxID=2020868 RepID=UPI003562E6AD